MSAIRFNATLYSIRSWQILSLPAEASNKLSSRAIVMVTGTIQGFSFQAPLEPDGKGSHWLRVSKAMLSGANTSVGETLNMVIEQSRDWPEPDVPPDFRAELAKDPAAFKQWLEVTVKAHWDWVRWINSAKQPETRKRRIGIALDKLRKGIKRPCCFNRNMCTELYVSHNGVLSNPS
ncbi:MAG: hypothetical protein CVU50_10055 [Candidatus Cloacimonetes bacterium HGW-Cloacimonetes-3]|nr:MAG: hypothetical protein CVU50_10055 [Candidatus Cloacimonetes bacterium HGW-Cloacimonetes-3]